MKSARALPAKLSMPRLPGVHARRRVFTLLDRALDLPALWIEAPPGAGKTTLAASWLLARKRACVWYQVDAGDADPATFFHYLGLAAKHAAPRYRRPLPHLTPEFLPGLRTFSRRVFEELFRRLRAGTVLVLDNVQDAGAESSLYELTAHPETLATPFLIGNEDSLLAFLRGNVDPTRLYFSIGQVVAPLGESVTFPYPGFDAPGVTHNISFDGARYRPDLAEQPLYCWDGLSTASPEAGSSATLRPVPGAMLVQFSSPTRMRFEYSPAGDCASPAFGPAAAYFVR